MPTIATCTVLGHLTADAESIPGERIGCRFRFWTSDKDRNGEKKFTHFRAAIWGPQAEWMLRDGKKGSVVFVSGSFRLESFEGKNGKSNNIEIRASEARVVESKAEREAASDTAAAPQKQANAPQTVVDDGSLPPF